MVLIATKVLRLLKRRLELRGYWRDYGSFVRNEDVMKLFAAFHDFKQRVLE
jgi:hypothetical protein